MKRIREVYYDVSQGLSSAKKLYEKLKHEGITMKQINQFLQLQETSQMHKPIVKQREYIPIMAFYPNEIAQLDIIDMYNISTTNSNFKYLLSAIDIFTRIVCVVPMKYKNEQETHTAVTKILKTLKPQTVENDNGSEFISTSFKL